MNKNKLTISTQSTAKTHKYFIPINQRHPYIYENKCNFTWKSNVKVTPFACIITQRTSTWSAKLTFQLWSPRCLLLPAFSDVQVLLCLWQTVGTICQSRTGARPAQACINSYIKHRPSHTALMLFEAPSLLNQSSCASLLSHDSLLQRFKPGLP